MLNGDHLLNYHDAVVYPSDLALLESPTAWLNDACINFWMTRLQQTQGERRAARERTRKRRKNDEADDGDIDGDGGRVNHLDDLFLDPSVVSFLMHQLSDEDEEYEDELSNLNASWNLPGPATPSIERRDETAGLGPSRLGGSTQACRRKRVFVPVSDQFGASRSTFARPGGGNHWSLLLWEIDAPCHDADAGSNSMLNVGFRHFDSSSGLNASAARAAARKLLAVLRSSMSWRDGAPDNVGVVECRAPQQRNGHDCGVFALGFAEALSACGGQGLRREREEEILRSLEEIEGHEGFAIRLRKRIADDIRELARSVQGNK